MTDFDKGGKVSGAKTMPPRHVVAANNDGVISQTVGELERQAAANQPNAAGGPGKEYGSSGISGRETHASYRKGS